MDAGADRAWPFQRPDRLHDPLYVVCMVSNPVRYRARWTRYADFAAQVARSGAILYTVEVAFGRRDFAITEADHPHHLQLRTRDEVWHKENALNLGFQRLPPDWRFGAWLDADIAFARGDWADETRHQLQHYAAVQMWSEAHELDPRYERADTYRSFAWCWHHRAPHGPAPWSVPGKVPLRVAGYAQPAAAGVHYWHPGYGWAFRREAFDALGGLIDWAVLGGGDLYMARALCGVAQSPPRSLGVTGQAWLARWQARADAHIRGNVGYVDGTLLHFWHGPKAARAYVDRGQILVDADFDPARDLKRDAQGLWQLEPEAVALRDGIRRYFRARAEDAI